MSVEARMLCPICGESISVQAKKCRFCGEWLAVDPHTTPCGDANVSIVQPCQEVHLTDPRAALERRCLRCGKAFLDQPITACPYCEDLPFGLTSHTQVPFVLRPGGSALRLGKGEKVIVGGYCRLPQDLTSQMVYGRFSKFILTKRRFAVLSNTLWANVLRTMMAIPNLGGPPIFGCYKRMAFQTPVEAIEKFERSVVKLTGGVEQEISFYLNADQEFQKHLTNVQALLKLDAPWNRVERRE